MISALTQVGGCGLLFRFACSAVLWGGRGTADQYLWPVWGALIVFQPHGLCPRSQRVWGALAVFRPHGLCPHSRVCAFPVYTALAPGCSIGSGPCVVCSSSFWVLHKDADLVGSVFCVFPGQSSSGTQELTGALSRVGCTLSPLRPQPQFLCRLVWCALCLFSGAALQPRPSRQMSTIQNLRKSLVINWEPVCSLVGEAVSGAEFSPFPSPPASCLQRGMGMGPPPPTAG